MNLQLLLDRALGHHRKGEVMQAEPLYRELLESRPHPTVLFLLGLLCAQTGRAEEALHCYEKALALQPNHVDALCGRGDVLKALGRPVEALRSYDKVVALRPNHVDAIFQRGNALRDLKRFADAVQSYDRVLVLSPDAVGGLKNRGAALLDLKAFERALADFDRLVSLAPADADAHYNRGQALAELYRFDAALEALDKALTLKPDHAGALSNRGLVLWSMERFDEALTSYDRALEIMPDLVTTVSNRANTLGDMGRLDEALAGHEHAIAMALDSAATHWNKALCLLLMGRLVEGFEAFEWRKRHAQFPFPVFPKPEWREEDIAGKSLFVQSEQGLGDTLQFCRYLTLAEERGAKLTFCVQKPLIRLMRSLSPSLDIRGWGEQAPSSDFYIYLMSMPLALGTALDTIPARVPYLHPEPDRVGHWQTRLGCHGFKIGISWRGRSQGPDGRFFLLRHMAPLTDIAGVRLISLQKKTDDDELSDLPPGMAVENLGKDFDSGEDAFCDSAAVMQTLDLVVSADTAIVHLAGAMGRPVWLAAKHVPNWRWMLGRDDSPWYPSMRIFRQTRTGDWTSVFVRMRDALAGLAR